ncbi:BirA family transcriptional regulator, biotin operon repressor / biotin-[acetyl-CoA-carboxylase] ligase [Halogranum amylolyticum]|uniref:BirA family transcriptional regulator, biotin operon repressor / biotin-[acetyl-CoA-carboxylase] ligase n=1 Tax=Halogranum amylolyticum TaxID=660520 RepID=A0A1H8U0E2_9EURY|nr:biotin--[acetyl-CoA-carboxylase] ligase [Halogranum amylolyticum]SEO96334.1 BirA family transcriptional regulator, biotin operon repressor / biotin-[acetyl-CoA-carboxylase] ligase [Halogranum amylolyticum]
MDSETLTDRLDAPVEVHGSIPNTTDELRRLAHDGAPHGTTVVADELTAARGRTGSAWSAPSGGLWTSTLVRPSFDADHVGRLTFAAGVAVADAVSSLGVDARLKWPNDVLVSNANESQSARSADDVLVAEKKLAGVLTESVHDGVPVAGKPVDEVFPDGDAPLDYVILGIGVNANVDPTAVEADRPVTSLRAATGDDVDRTELAVRLHENLLRRCRQAESDDGFAAVLDDYRAASETLGRTVRIERRGRASVEGIARDVTETGALVVETGEETVVVTEGECRRLRGQ